MRIRIYALIFVIVALASWPVYAGKNDQDMAFKDLNASFSYDGDQTGTVEICNPTNRTVHYSNTFEKDKHFFHKIHQSRSEDDQPIIAYSFVAETAKKEKMGLHVGADDGSIVSLVPLGCHSHKFDLPLRGIISHGVSLKTYKFRIYITIFDPASASQDRAPIPTREGAARVEAIMPDRRLIGRSEHVTFESPLYQYQSEIRSGGDLALSLTQDGEQTLITACNSSDQALRFIDHLFLTDPRHEPFGIYAEYKVAENPKTKKTRILFWPDPHAVNLKPIAEVTMRPRSCLSRAVDVVSVLRAMEDRAAAKGMPMRIESFRVHAAVFEEKPKADHRYADMDFAGSWVDLKQAAGESEALDYNALDVTFKTEGAETAITVCNNADKPVVFRDSLFLDQPEKKPIGLIAEVAYDSLLSKYEFLDKVFYQVSLPRVRDAELGPKDCKTKTVNLGRALSVYLRANPPPEGKKVAQYRPVVVLYEDAWDFSPGKLPHRIFGGEWADYEGKTAP